MVVIVYSEIAISDLKDIYRYIAKDSKHYAKTEVKLIREFVRKLKDNIWMGKNFDRMDESVGSLFLKTIGLYTK